MVPLFHLCREDMRNSFNFLLIALICMDSSYLIGWIIEAFRKSFHVSGRKEAASGIGDPEAYAASFHMEYRRSADYIQCQLYLASLVAASWLCLCLGRHTLKYYVKEMGGT